MSSRALSLVLVVVPLVAALAVGACKPKDSQADSESHDAALTTSSGVPEVVPPAAPFNATPVAQFADAGNIDGKPPFEQATFYEANGQLWMARLVLERKALDSDGTPREAELLAKICQQQGDEPCLEACAKKLGRKIKLDGGAGRSAADAGAVAGQEHKEPDTELAKARDLVLKKQFDIARKSLEPKVLDGKASREEIRLLQTICEQQRDRMCVALCASKLK
jgi:hypothetical protein